MATFKKSYKVRELLDLVNRGSLCPFCWMGSSYRPTFYLIDCRREFSIAYDKVFFCTHRSNYYRLKNKVSSLPFDVFFERKCAFNTIYFFLQISKSSYNFSNEKLLDMVYSLDKLKRLNDISNGEMEIPVVVL